ncbi:MAG: extracellular solute-binding protein [Neisseria sp.]|nr:extracellular solute-binding protein [Neisseria sp.]
MKKLIASLFVGLAFTAQAAHAVGIEKRSMDELYQAALKEGGKLVVYAGGDTPEQQNGIKAAFEQRFPGMTLDVVVDYSKVHDARIDNQIATRSVVADIVQLQTLQDFPRWKASGDLMAYKPRGWDKVYKDFKDKNGAWTGVFVDAFSNVAYLPAFPQGNVPREAADYLKPELQGKIISTYPNDDDAVLFWYKQTIDRHGWQWMADFMKQKPHFVRGTQAPADDVESGKYWATFSTDGSLKPDAEAKSRFTLPEKDGFVAWAQRAAILKQAKHPEAAKLYLNWLLDKDTQSNVWYMWSVRTDVAPPAGYKPIWAYPNANLKAFERFMANRAEVEQFRSQIALYVGDVKGESSAGVLGLHPVKALR